MDVENQCWRPCKPMQTERTYFGGETLYSRLYLRLVLLGFLKSKHQVRWPKPGVQGPKLVFLHCFRFIFEALCDTECFDCLRGAWMPGPDLNVPRRSCASAQLAGRIYALGGFDGTQILSHVEAFDPRMKSWMPLEHMTVPRSSAAACAFNGQLWVLGGTSGSRLRSVERPRLEPI